MSKISYAFLIFFISTLLHAGGKPSDADILADIKYFGDSCLTSKIPTVNNQLILIDATDSLKDSQIQFLKDNFINNYNWKEENDKITLAILNNNPVASLDFVSLCAPIPESKLKWYMPKKLVLRNIGFFKRALDYSFNDLMKKAQDKSQNTNLIEAIVEIYRSKRYGFDNQSSNRELIIASDLYQNSLELSFYKLCIGIKCPSFKDMGKDKRFSDFLNNFAKPIVTNKDSVKIYAFRPRANINFSLGEWWVDFLNFAGFSTFSKSDITYQ